jgi:hypothetical protein
MQMFEYSIENYKFIRALQLHGLEERKIDYVNDLF